MPPHSARRFQWLVIWQNVISIILVFFIGLALRACLNRSAFIARFTELVGCPPMIILRDLRMRKAAQQLKANGFSIDQIAQNAGYGSRSSFVGAFRRAYGSDPVANSTTNPNRSFSRTPGKPAARDWWRASMLGSWLRRALA